MLKKPIVYLAPGLAFMIIAWLLQVFAGDYYNSRAYFTRLVQGNIDDQLRLIEQDMVPVLDSVATVDIVKFSDFNLEVSHAYYVYRQNELILWSNYKVVPPFPVVAGDFAIKAVTLDNNVFIARKWLSESPAGKLAIVSLLPVFVDFSVQNNYLADFANKNIFLGHDVRVVLMPEKGALPVVVRGHTLFWLANDPGFVFENSPFNKWLLAIYSLAILLLITGFYLWAATLARQKGKWVLLLAVLLLWLGLKGVMYLSGFPMVFLGIDLFDSRFYTVSLLERSFGDMLLNTVMIFLLSLIVFKHYRLVKPVQGNSKWRQLGYATGIFFLLNLVINYQYLQLRTIYFNSQISLDITQTLAFDNFRILSVLVFLLISASTMLLFHVLFKRMELLVPRVKDKFIVLLGGSLLFWLFTYGANMPVANLLAVTIGISLFLFVTGIHRSLQQLSNAITVYILFWLITEAAIGGWCISQFEQVRETNEMVRYAQNLAAKNDYMAEFMLHQAVVAIQKDPSISTRLSNPFLAKDFIVKKIKAGYLNKYLDKYNIAIYLYSHSGEGIPGFGTTLEYQRIKSRYALPENKTEFANIYILTQEIRSLAKHYMAFVPVSRYRNVIGYIILDLRQKRLVPQNVYPELLVDNRFVDYQKPDYSYAIFEGNMLIQSSGEMDYHYFDATNLPDNNPFVQYGYRHYVLQDNKGDTVVVSKESRYLWQVVSNTNFLLTVLIVPIILLLGLYLGYQLQQGQQISYIARIQLFLNLAFFIPLALVTVTTLSFITASFKQALIAGKLEESSRLAEQIERETDAYLVDVAAKDLLTDKVTELADYGRFDANVYGTDGLLITTTEPGIFSSGLQSVYLNPVAFARIVEQHEPTIVASEQIGSLRYYTTYAAIKSPETNRLLGVLAMPFFRAEKAIEANQISALTTILNVFILIFILALLATFQTSRWLTAPLLLIREKLGQTSFSGENKPIAWNSDDEIGKLIAEYNNMLVKLEASKEALARSQKESAWREVAQQVAHEIKNPLTPMKLTLQKLEQAVNRQDKESSARIAQTVKNLLQQLQMLNDIVTSFSEFAKMPIPRNEKMNLAELLHELEVFFAHEETIHLELQLHAAEVFISADYKLMNRIITNIIINAGQSAKQGQEKVAVKIKTMAIPAKQAIQIIITDNGTGIAADVVDRVFIPRFSTKKEGSGIGLAVAKHGIEHAGGTIWFETKWGEGTTFYMELPQIE